MQESDRLQAFQTVIRDLASRAERLVHAPNPARLDRLIRDCEAVREAAEGDGRDPYWLPTACRQLKRGDVQKACWNFHRSDRRLCRLISEIRRKER